MKNNKIEKLKKFSFSGVEKYNWNEKLTGGAQHRFEEAKERSKYSCRQINWNFSVLRTGRILK